MKPLNLMLCNFGTEITTAFNSLKEKFRYVQLSMISLGVLSSSFALAGEASFFANPEIEAKFPSAFALQAESSLFVQEIEHNTKSERENLVHAIQSDPELKRIIAIWPKLTLHEQIPYLRQIFEIEVKVLNITPPELIIKSGIIPGAAYFDFDPEKPGTGKVILNPEALDKEKNKYVSLALLIHETRHSAQFQMAFPTNASSPFSRGYGAAFVAQKSLKGKLSFCDFLTLLNEYEAFQFGNYVLGKLTNWKIDMVDMGTFASQYDSHGTLKIDLAALLKDVGSERLLETFNELEKLQKDQLTEGN